ncbi:MAG: DUF4397 domain-containing protein [Chitinophagaceae bacterium]
MIRIKNIIVISFIAMGIISGCEKNTYNVTDRTTNEGAAQVKLGYFAAYTVLPNTILYINDKPVSNTLLAPVSFPGGGLNMNGSLNGDYLLVSPGATKIQGFAPVPATGNIMTKLFEFTETFAANKSYTYFVTDTAANITGFNVEDTKTAPDSGYVRVKFVNAMPNVPSLDLYRGSTNATASIFASAVPYKGVTGTFDVALPTDSFFIRPAGALPTTTPIARRAWAANLTNKRIYTILARGYNGSVVANLAPNLSVIVNQ